MFIISCKYIKNLLYKRGYLKKLQFKHDYNPFIFSNYFTKHQNTLEIVNVNSLNNPQYFMNGVWPKYVYLYNCFIDGILSPLKTKTEILKIVYYRPIKLSSNFSIDWNKFSKIKILYLEINTFNIDFLKDIYICKDLEILCLILNKNFEIPNIIGKLTNLKYVITNCNININTLFISKNLKHCISKNMSTNNFTKNNIIKDRNKYFYDERLIFSDLMNYMSYL